MNEKQSQNQQLQIKANDEDLKGNYANAMQISYTTEEFVMDFLLIHPPVGQMVSRIITSPGHIKRIVMAMQDSIKKYEDQFGLVEEASAPVNPIGFKTDK